MRKTDAVDVEGKHGKRHHPTKALSSERQDPVETTAPEVVDRRVHRRMLAPHRHEFLDLLAHTFRLVDLASLRQHLVIEQVFKAEPIPGVV